MGMKIMLTGASGMVGSTVSHRLLSEGHDVRSPTSKEVNLKDYRELREYISTASPDLVIHCAGTVGGILDNINRPYSFCTDNILMGYNIIEASRQCSVKRLINLSSSCIYPPLSSQPFQEESILTGPLEPTNEGYALAKTLVMKCIEYSNKQYSTTYKSIIPCNLYGVGDKFDESHSHMIPGVIRRMHKAVKSGQSRVAMWGNPETRREFMYVGDLANCIVRIVKEYDKCPVTLNIGFGKDYSISQYYTAIASIVGFEGEMVIDNSKPIGMKSKLIDSSKVESTYGWKPEVELHQGIKLTYEYYKSTLTN